MARYFGAQLDVIAMDVFTAPATPAMSKVQLADLFWSAPGSTGPSSICSPISSAAAQRPDRAELLALELARGEAYRLLAERARGERSARCGLSAAAAR